MTTLHVDGADLFYLRAGEQGDHPVLLIHGSTVDLDTWGACFDDLARDHDVLAYDRRGHARSPATVGQAARVVVGCERHARDAAAFLGLLGPRPATVVGWSAGGIVALRLALVHPSRVAAVVLAEPALGAPRTTSPAYLQAYTRHAVRFAAGREQAAYERFMQFICTRPRVAAHPLEHRRVSARAVPVGLASARGAPTADELLRVAPPVTVLLGEQSDRWYERLAVGFGRRIPQATVRRIPGDHHAFGFSDPNALADGIRGATAAALLSRS